MNAASSAAPAVATNRGAKPQPPAPFEKPSPGSWTLDLAHCERPVSRFLTGIFEASFARGFRDGFERYGGLLETIEAALVNGFAYTCVRPFGAPAEPKGLPPKAVFKAMMTLHPEIRKRVRRSQEAMESRIWRDDMRRFTTEWAPPVEAHTARLLSAPIEQFNDATLADHLQEIYDHLKDSFFLHHRMNATRIIPVGDFIAHAQQWTGATTLEILTALRGASPDSRKGLAELSEVAALIASDAGLKQRVETDGDAESLIGDLESRTDALGDAVRRWIATVGHQVTGYSPGYPTLRETPTALVESIKAVLAGSRADDAAKAGRVALEKLRARVPAEHREEFDALFEEARFVYYMRDHLCLHSLDSFSATRLALLEAGRRLAARGRIHEPAAAFEATVEELRSMLTDGGGPSADELQRHVEWSRSVTADDVPAVLGPLPGAPPPDDWLPKGVVRMQRAVNAYVEAMMGESKETSSATVVRGLGASGGKRTGTARLVLEPGDFDRISPGDVLVARITTPSYNILLPMLAGIVTDRGGVLSHPAIVSREYGIPGVVGTRNGTSLIPDGAIVEVDGDAGTVRVLS
jgi:rifampicin phosphotransferase